MVCRGGFSIIKWKQVWVKTRFVEYCTNKAKRIERSLASLLNILRFGWTANSKIISTEILNLKSVGLFYLRCTILFATDILMVLYHILLQYKVELTSLPWRGTGLTALSEA